MVVICGGYGRGKVSRWKTKLNLKNDQKPKQPIVSNKSRLVSFAGQVTGFLGPKACASSSNVRAQCVIPSYPRSERVPKHTKKGTGKQSETKTHLRERSRVWDLQTAHAVLVSRFLEVCFVRSSSPVRRVPADLTRKLDVQAVQFVQPVRNGFPVEPQGEFQGVVH